MLRKVHLLRSFLLALVTVLAVVVSGVRAAAEPYDISAILPLTGVQAFLGNAEAQALAVLQDKTNYEGGIGGRPVHFVIQDEQSNPQTGVQLANGILAKDLPFILGPSMAGVCSAVAPLMKNGPVNYCFTPGIHPPVGSWVYSAAPSSADAFEVATHFFRDRGWKKIAILASIDASGQDGEHELDSALTEHANKDEVVVDREHFNLTDVSVSAQLARIEHSGAQVLVAWSSGTPTATILRAVMDTGLDLPILSSGANLTYCK